MNAFGLARVCVVVVLLFGGSEARAQEPPATPAPAPASASAPEASGEAKAEAKRHFEQGLVYFDRQEWAAALAEFQKSRELFPTRAATKNAALCLRKENRFDEALDMYEALLEKYPDLTEAEVAFVRQQISELLGLVGTLEIRGSEDGASVVVDGRERGTVPLSAPLRTAIGDHQVNVSKQGFDPFHTKVSVVARQRTTIEAHLGALIKGGRLRVTEANGRTSDVIVDDVQRGKTPWEGTLTVGTHAVMLRAEGDLGTQPAEARIKLNELTPLTLVTEPLEAAVRIVPIPSSAAVAVDGVSVGFGVWDGKLRAGGHLVEVAAEGFLVFSRQVNLEKGRREVLTPRLERDPTSSLWGTAHPPKVVIELVGAMAVSPSFGGDLANDCTGTCTGGIPLGARGALRGAYQLSSGIGIGAEVGYLFASVETKQRATTLVPQGLSPNPGVVNDVLRLGGIAFGGRAFYHSSSEDWPVTLGLGAGLLLGSLSDSRTGTFTTLPGPPPNGNLTYSIDAAQTPGVTYLYAAPEVRLGRRVAKHIELSIGCEVLLLAGLRQPRWDPDARPVNASPDPNRVQGNGYAVFQGQSLAAPVLLMVVPGLGARYDF